MKNLVLKIQILAIAIILSLGASAQDSTNLIFPFSDTYNPYGNGSQSPFYLPPSSSGTATYDPTSGKYIVRQRINGTDISQPIYMDFEQYQRYQAQQQDSKYWSDKAGAGGSLEREGMIPKLYLAPKAFDKIFGGNTVDIRPQGTAELIFGGNFNRNDNPAATQQQRFQGNFKFDMRIQLNVVGKIGDKLKFTANQNTQSFSAFDDLMKLEYKGYDDDIIKTIEGGNVNLPLRSSLIRGSQSLFGLKSEMQFGKMRVTALVARQEGQSRTVTVQGGAQVTHFDKPINEYDPNRHFFISQYFREQYNNAMRTLPVISSNVTVTRIEVWVTRGNSSSTDVRDVVAFQDLAEPKRIGDRTNTIVTNSGIYPFNNTNNLYGILQNDPNFRSANNTLDALENGPLKLLANTRDYEKTFARKLTPSEYSFNPQLGYISLNASLNNDQVLAIAYEYTINGQVFRVGEFSQEVTSEQNNPSVLFLKLLKATTIRTDLPIWDLMMKNIYRLDAYQISQDRFELNVMYKDVRNGIKNFIPEDVFRGKPLIRVLNLDNLNVQKEPTPDGVFDFLPNLTINTNNGLVIFPVIEPFGNDLKAAFGSDTLLAQKYVYQQLYDSTQGWAVQFPEKNRFRLMGQYQGLGSGEISLNAIDVPRNSVKVRAGNRQLTEGVDFQVDYQAGKVRILDPGLTNSGELITASFDDNPLINTSTQQPTMVASRFDYTLNKDILLGGTILHYGQRPFTQKVNQGDEPVSNTVIGLDGGYQVESRGLTRAIDRLPFISTKQVSTITLNAEAAALIPGNARVIGKGGISYIDDFEGTENSIDVSLFSQWSLASTPAVFPEAPLRNNFLYGENRAKMAWYSMDPIFYQNSAATPEHIRNDVNMKSNHFMRLVLEQEVFPNRQNSTAQPLIRRTLDLQYYPSERGPYNFDAQRITADGLLLEPKKRWAGIQRTILTNDFENANIEFVEFWMMDPFVYNPSHKGGDFYLNLGTVSEDILRDGRQSYENGLPRTGGTSRVDTTNWGLVPRLQPIINAFDNNPQTRADQDVGLDGLNNVNERRFPPITDFLNVVENGFGANSQAFVNAQKDPSSDNYHHFRGSDYDANQADILSRYKEFNGLEANSPPTENSPEPYATQSSNQPNTEDINLDNSLTQAENYYEYRISMRPADMVVGMNNIVDINESSVVLKNGRTERIKWYQFRVPIAKPTRRVGNVVDFKSIRFMRMYLTNFEEPIVCRFATVDLIRMDWRRYTKSLQLPGEYVPSEGDEDTKFIVSTVNIEENAFRQPVNYVTPPGIVRQTNAYSAVSQQLNEQSLQLKFCNLKDGDARAAFKNSGFDIRSYKRIKLFIHAEGADLRPNDVNAFVRFGSDFVGNYYEYEVPLMPTRLGTTAKDTTEIWKADNEMSISFEELNAVKRARNASKSDFLLPFTQIINGRKITIVGNPTLSSIEILMLGVRNPKQIDANTDDGLAKCGEVWFNEFRLTEFDNRGGYAATGTASVRLADLGTVNLSGTLATVGYGGVDSKVSERNRDDNKQYDVSSNIELGKLLPEKIGLRLPMYASYSQARVTPQYNPLDRDVLMTNFLQDYTDAAQRDSVVKASETFTQRRSITFSNIQKTRNQSGARGKKPHKPAIYDLENFALNYAYNEINMRDPFTSSNQSKQYRGGMAYNFNTTPKTVEPFKDKIKSRHLAFIRDFNFNYLPSSIGFRTDLDRRYQEVQLRNNSKFGIVLPATINKNFVNTRVYNLRYDLTRALNVDFDANVTARIDEPAGRINTDTARQQVINNLKKLGRTTAYSQSLNANYTLPFSKFTFLDYMSGTLRYGSTFAWAAAPLSAPQLDNTIQNSQSVQLNAQVNFTSLYNKSKFLKNILTDKPPTPAQPKASALPNDKEDDKNKNKKTPPKKVLPKKAPVKTKKDLANNKTAKDKDQFGEDINGTNGLIDGKSKAEQEKNPFSLGKTIGRLVLSLKSVSLSYSNTSGTLIPGFNQTPEYFGNNFSANAPGLPFVFGDQADMRQKIAANNWLTKSTQLNSFYTNNKNESINGRVSIEPFRDFRIDINLTLNENNNLQTNFRFDTAAQAYTSFTPLQSGSYTVSMLSLPTTFKKFETDTSAGNYLFSQNYQNFEQNRLSIANRLAANDPRYTGARDTLGYPVGYGGKSGDVLLPAFYAAFADKSAGDVALGFRPISRIPLPNWRISYNGLSRLPWARQYFQSFTLNHSYRSTYTVSNYASNLLYNPKDANNIDLSGNYYTQYQIAQATISEQFSPLIGIDMTLKNSLTARLEYKQDRTMSVSLVNARFTDMQNKEFVIGMGYRMNGSKLPLLINGRRLKNDLDMRFDFSIRDNITILRDIDGELPLVSQGIRSVSIKPNINYKVNEKITVRLFFDRIMNSPKVASSYRTVNTQGGFSLRFNLAN